MLSAALAAEWADLELATGTTDHALDGHVPQAVARPRDATEAGRLLTTAHREGLAVVPWGGGTHQGLGRPLSRYDLALDTGALGRVREHHAGDLILTAEAGTTLAEVQDILRGAGQFLPLEAEDPARATIGGLLATGLSGPLRMGYRGPRDFTIWTEAVAADGALVHGGAKVVKNVAGYDLPKLYVGSLGSLGLLTAACFRVMPLPASRPTALLGFEEPGEAEETLAVLRSGKLGAVVATLVHGDPGWGEPYDRAPWVLAIGFDGPVDTTRWQIEQSYALGRDAQASLATALMAEDESLACRQALMSPRRTGSLRLRLSLLPAQVASLLDAVAYQPDAPDGVFAETSAGVIRCVWRRAGEGWREVARLVEDLGGHWVLEAAPAEVKATVDVWGRARGDQFLQARLKAALDPRGVLNPGRSPGG